MIQAQSIVAGYLFNKEDNIAIEGALIYVQEHTAHQTLSDHKGFYSLKIKKHGLYNIIISCVGYKQKKVAIQIDKDTIIANIFLETDANSLQQVIIEGDKRDKTFGIKRMNGIDGTTINEGKKNEVIVIGDLSANLSTNNARQIFTKVPGINVWESDGGGLQLGIGGRGLSPNRSANFNIRQNGYDISADALGYPESYYTPPSEALEKIELIRGASSLQYGTQFGGMLNFVMKEGTKKKPLELLIRNTAGSWGFWNTTTSLGGTKGKFNYYTIFQHKQGNGWRPNSNFNQNTSYSAVSWQATKKIKIAFNYTYMSYLAKQPGGLTDAQFAIDPKQSMRDRNWFQVHWSLPAVSLQYQLSNKTTFNLSGFALLANRNAIGNLEDVSKKDLLTNRLLLIDKYRNVGAEARLLHLFQIGKYKNASLIGCRIYNGKTFRDQGFGTAKSDANFNYNQPESPELSAHQFNGKNISLFFEHVFYYSKKLSITPGIRYESIFTGINGYFNERVLNLAGNLIAETKTFQNEGRPRKFFLMGLGLSYKFDTTKAELYGNITQNYRAVTYSDIAVYNPNVQIDPNLKDENGYSIETGLRGQWNNIFTYDIGGFYMAYDNRIGTRLNTQNKRFRTNIADAKIIGAETYAELDIIRLANPNSKYSFSYFSNLALINATYHTAEKQYNLNKVELVPNTNWRTGFTFRKSSFSTSFTYSYISAQYTDATNAEKPNAAATIGALPAYQVFDISLKYRYKRAAIEASCNNVLDNYYFTRRADGYPGPGIIPSDGRGFYITLEVRL